MKNIALHEGLNLQFRAELFNLLDRANFNTPNLILAVLPPGSTIPQANPGCRWRLPALPQHRVRSSSV